VRARPPPPGAADRVERAALAAGEEPRVAERLAYQLLGPLDLFLGNVLQRQSTKGQRDPGLDPVPVDVGELERAAAEIADDAVGAMKAGDHTEGGQFGLALAGDDVDLGSANALGLGDERLAVLGIAASGSRDP